MLDSATQNAKSAAETFAKILNLRLVKLNLPVGVYLLYLRGWLKCGDTSNINKKVRVVTSIQFFLKLG